MRGSKTFTVNCKCNSYSAARRITKGNRNCNTIRKCRSFFLKKKKKKNKACNFFSWRKVHHRCGCCPEGFPSQRPHAAKESSILLCCPSRTSLELRSPPKQRSQQLLFTHQILSLVESTLRETDAADSFTNNCHVSPACTRVGGVQGHPWG